MDTIQFEREQIQVDGRDFDLAKIIINGTPFIATVREYELPFARKYNQENIAGGYMYVYADYLYELLTGERQSDEHENEVPILICQCGCEGCWDLLVSVVENDTEVQWVNIHNPHRSSPSSAGGFWDYSMFPELRFNKEQYQKAIMDLATIAEA